MLKEADFRILQLLVSTQLGERPMTVAGIVKAFGISQSLASQRLRQLEATGYVERISTPTSQGRVVIYRPKPTLEVHWISPDERVALRWRTFDEVDWSFPLVSQVPDQAARFTLLAFLHRLQGERLLLPQSLDSKPGRPGAQHFGLSFIVYGSCARGTARPGSDLDLLSVQGDGKEAVGVGQVVENIAADVSLSAARPIQLKHLEGDELVDLPTGIKSSIQTEGIVVFDGVRSKARGYSRRVWDFVYGGRNRADV